MKKKDGISKEHLLYIRKLKLETVIVWMLRIFLLIFLLGLWELLARTGVMDPFITSYPSEILVTIKELFAEDDIICEAFDVPENKAMLVNGVLEQFSDKIIVSASGMAGYGDSNTIRTRKVAGRFYLCGDETSDSRTGMGLMAPRVSICAGHEANLIAQLLIDSI